MRVLMVFDHPYGAEASDNVPARRSFSAAIAAAARRGLEDAGHEVDLIDLHRDRFEPVMHEQDHRRSITAGQELFCRFERLDREGTQAQVVDIASDAIITVQLDIMYIIGVTVPQIRADHPATNGATNGATNRATNRNRAAKRRAVVHSPNALQCPHQISAVPPTGTWIQLRAQFC